MQGNSLHLLPPEHWVGEERLHGPTSWGHLLRVLRLSLGSAVSVGGLGRAEMALRSPLPSAAAHFHSFSLNVSHSVFLNLIFQLLFYLHSSCFNETKMCLFLSAGAAGGISI